MASNEISKPVREHGRDESIPMVNSKMKEKTETKVVTDEQMIQNEIADTQKIGAVALVDDVNLRVETAEDKHDLFQIRLGIEGLRSLLNRGIQYLDERMAKIMKEEKITKFETGWDDRRVTVFLGQEKKKTVKKDGAYDLALKVRKLLQQSEDPSSEMILSAMGTSPSAMKWARVKEYCDTVGIDSNEYLAIEYKDRIVLQYIPNYVLEKL